MRTDPGRPEVAAPINGSMCVQVRQSPTVLPSAGRQNQNLVERIRGRVVYSDPLE